MKHILPMVAVAGICLSLQAATFELYRDGAVYTYKPAGTFVGFVPKQSRAECGDRTLSIVSSTECPKESRLCREKATIERWSLDSAYAQRRMTYIDALMKRAEVKIADPKAVLAMAEKAAQNYATMQKRKEMADKEVKWRREAFSKQAPSLEPQHLAKACDGNVKLILPGRFISFDMLYIADISDEKKVGITQRIELRNRSGIDIEAERATLYYQPMNRYLRPIRFSPWIVHDRAVPKAGMMRKMAMPASSENLAADIAYAAVETENPRHYRIKELKLPSNGEKVDISVGSWRVDAEREERVYPYRDLRVYHVVRFQPNVPVETNRWRILESGKVVASNVSGEYRNGRYTLFVSVDEDVVVQREKMVLKEKESFFGGTVRKKDGYVIRLVNQSNETKRLKIVDRIPVAVRSDVEVKLLSVRCDQTIEKRLLEKGRLEMDVSMPPKSHAEVRVLFEVSYDKEKPIVY